MSDSETENLPVAAPTTANFLAVISKAAIDGTQFDLFEKENAPNDL